MADNYLPDGNFEKWDKYVEDGKKENNMDECGELGPKKYFCTRPKGHIGNHIAMGGTKLCEEWAQQSPMPYETLLDRSAKYETIDSGKRETFESGMQRDTQEGKTRYDLVYMPMFIRWAELMTRGAAKYTEDNWKKATGEPELKRFRASAFRHFIQWFLGATDEDHAAAVLFNISGAEYVKERLSHEKKS